VYHDVPAFLELRERVREQIGATTELKGANLRFVIADDSAGRDGEIDALSADKDTEVVVPPFNLGHQRAIVYTLRTISDRIRDDDVVITLDADGEDRPQDIPALARELLRHDGSHTVVLARRTKRKESLRFKLFYTGFKLLFRALTGTIVRTGNFAAYRGAVVRTIAAHPYFDLSYSASLNSLDFDVEYVPCPRGERYAGRSQMGVQGLMMHGLSMLVPFTDRIALRAMFLFTATVVASIVAAIAVIAIKIFSDADVPGWATYTLLALFISSLIALGNFVILFIVFSQSRGVSLRGLESSDG
jgi:hypothetical protein